MLTLYHVKKQESLGINQAIQLTLYRHVIYCEKGDKTYIRNSLSQNTQHLHTAKKVEEGFFHFYFS